MNLRELMALLFLGGAAVGWLWLIWWMGALSGMR
jgi:hypothetical protein